MTEEQLCHGRGGPRHYRLLRHAFFLKKLATRHKNYHHDEDIFPKYILLPSENSKGIMKHQTILR